MNINNNRIVTMSNGEVDWRHFLSSSVRKDFIADNELLGPVDSRVHLLMESKTPRYRTANVYETGVANLFESIGKTADKFTKDIPIIGETMAKLGITATDLATFMLDTGTSLLNPSIGGVSKSWNPWFVNAPTWEGVSSTLSFEYTFNFSMGQFGLWDAKEEVMKPILNLLAPTMVQEITNFTMTGPYSRTIDVLKDLGQDAVTSLLGALAFAGYGEGTNPIGDWDNLLSNTLDINFGGVLHLSSVLLKNSDIVFSSEVDENGYPISGSATLYFATVVPQAKSAPSGYLSMQWVKPTKTSGGNT